MALLKQSTVYTRTFKLIASSDHISLITGVTATVNLSKAGASFGVAGGAVSEIANGWYKVALTATDTNTLGDLSYYITGASADDTDFVDQVVAFDPQGLIAANVIQYVSGTASTIISGIPKVDIAYYVGGTSATPNKAGIPQVDVTNYAAGTVPTQTKPGIPSVNVNFWVAGTTNSLISGRVDSNAQVVGDKTAYSLSDPQTFSVTGNITGNVSGSVGSVTGAAGSVTGAVGSVTAPVTIAQGVNVTQYASGTVIAQTKTGIPTVNVKYFTDATTNALIAGRVDSNAQVVGDKTGYALSSAQTFDVTGSLSGSVGSVTGSVGSVTNPVSLAQGVNVTQWVGSTASTNVAGVPRVDVVFSGGTSPLLRIKKNVAYNNFTFPLVATSDHITLISGESVTGQVSIDGAAFGNLANAVSEIGTTGIYKVNLAAADVNGTDIMLKFTSTNADTRLIKFTTQV